MLQTWRWFGPHDLASMADIRQAGAQGIVSALHHIASGDVWPSEEIAKRQQQVRHHPDSGETGLEWTVVESLVVSEDIKKQTGDYRAHLANYRQSLENIAAAGIETVCYNFMPVIDWTRTDLAWRLASGGTAMRFDLADFALFDIHLLERPGASGDFSEAVRAIAAERLQTLSDNGRNALIRNIVAGLPGANENLTLDEVRQHLAQYRDISRDTLSRHLIDFLSEVVPTAERLGIRLCCHPDDPPFRLMGLPRVMSTADDYAMALDSVDSPANGMAFCSGSLGARHDNDLPAIVRRFGPKIHFIHLRNVRRENETVPCSFFEDEHLAGSTDMVGIIAAFVDEELRRKAEGRRDWQIPMRPDHGQDILDDLKRGGQPGYPVIGRLKGLAELRGVMVALEARIEVSG